MKDKVSVIIPVKNIDDYFCQALNSTINQTYENIEIIIIVDAECVQKMEFTLNKIVNKKNGQDIKIVSSKMSGIAAALNAGIQESQGAYIARMDSDDISDLTRIEKQINYFKLHIDCKVLGTRAKYVNEFGGEIGVSPIIRSKRLIYELMCFRNILIHPSVMINAEFLKKIGGYSNQPSEDYDLWLRCLEIDRKCVSILDEELIKYRVHQNQISNQTRIKGQAAVCNSIFSAMLRNFNIYIFMGLALNLTKLVFRKLQKFCSLTNESRLSIRPRSDRGDV